MGLQEVVAELKWIVEQGYVTNYAIGGAYAAYQYIEAKFTEDIDIFVAVSEPAASTLAPLGSLWPALIERGAEVQELYLVVGGWPLQFLASGSPLHEEAIATAREITIDGQVVRIMAPEYLALLALESGHNKHLVRIEELLARKVVSKEQLLPLVERFELTARWKNFETKFLTL